MVIRSHANGNGTVLSVFPDVLISCFTFLLLVKTLSCVLFLTSQYMKFLKICAFS